MSHHGLEVADIFQQHGPLWRQKNKGHISLGQLKVMSAIERCRTLALGGHKLSCPSCSHIEMAYNSCRNRHCPKCQATAAYRWLEARQADLLPVDYYHVVFTIPAQVNDIAYQNKKVVYGILFKAVSKTLSLIAKDKKHLGAKIGATLVLHTWGSAMTHHPHIHCIVPGGGLDDNQTWVSCRKGYFLPVLVLSALFKRLFLEMLYQAYINKQLMFYGKLTKIASERHFFYWIKPLKKKSWVVYTKKPFAGPKAVLAYLSRYTHRVAIANSRLLSLKDKKVTFKYKDYRKKGKKPQQKMILDVDDFIQRFLLHIIPSGFHRIRHIGLFANAVRKDNLAKIREQLLLNATGKIAPTTIKEELNNEENKRPEKEAEKPTYLCRKCGAVMTIIDVFIGNAMPRAPPKARNNE